MIDFDAILKDAIVSVVGLQGYEKFLKRQAGGGSKMLNARGEPDVHGILNGLLDVFPEDRAAAITDRALVLYREESQSGKRASTQKGQAVPVPVVAADRALPVARTPAYPESAAKSNLASFSHTPSSEIEDVINEAISLRKSMGKPLHNLGASAMVSPSPVDATCQTALLPDIRSYPATIGHSGGTSIPAAPPVEKSPEIASPTARVIFLEPGPTEITPELLTKEIVEFLLRQDSLLNVNSMDFSMYLKSKGYVFEEKAVLEELYVLLEQRKARVRAWVLQDIAIFLSGDPWPTEAKVLDFIHKLKQGGIVYDDGEIKRLVVAEMMRKI